MKFALTILLTLLLFEAPAHAGVNLSQASQYASVVNPSDYPCAKARISALYQNREHIANLSVFHPQRILNAVVEIAIFWYAKITHFFLSLFEPGVVNAGIRDVTALARSSNPFGAVEHKVDGWFSELTPRSKFALGKEVEKIIKDTTQADGSCK